MKEVVLNNSLLTNVHSNLNFKMDFLFTYLFFVDKTTQGGESGIGLISRPNLHSFTVTQQENNDIQTPLKVATLSAGLSMHNNCWIFLFYNMGKSYLPNI